MPDLGNYLAKHAEAQVASVIMALAGAASAIAAEIRMPATSLDEAAGAVNADGDTQKKLDVIADDIVLEALAGTGVASYLSEERDAAFRSTRRRADCCLRPAGRVFQHRSECLGRHDFLGASC